MCGYQMISIQTNRCRAWAAVKTCLFEIIVPPAKYPKDGLS